MGLFSREELSESEKIDFIFKRLKAEQRMGQVKLVGILTFGICLYLVIQFLAKPESEPIKKKAILFAQEKIATFVSPIVSGILDSVMADMVNKTKLPASSGGNQINSEAVNQSELGVSGNAIEGNNEVSTNESQNNNLPSSNNSVRTGNIRPSQAVKAEELPTVQGIKITPEMLDAVQKSINQ